MLLTGKSGNLRAQWGLRAPAFEECGGLTKLAGRVVAPTGARMMTVAVILARRTRTTIILLFGHSPRSNITRLRNQSPRSRRLRVTATERRDNNPNPKRMPSPAVKSIDNEDEEEDDDDALLEE